MAFSSKKNKCKEMEDLDWLSTEQLSSQYFALVKAMNNRNKELEQIQFEVQELDSKVKEGVKSLQELEHQEARLEQRKELLSGQLETVLKENLDLEQRVNKVNVRNEEKQATLEKKLKEVQSSGNALEKERCALQASIEHETDLQTKNEKDKKKIGKKIEEMRNDNQDIGGKISKIENKQQKVTERSYKLQKDNKVLDQTLKSSIDSYNEMKKELISLEKTLLEKQRSLKQSRAALSKNRDATQEKEHQLQATKASKFSTIGDLFLLNDSIRSLRSANKKTAAQIEQNRRDIVNWTDKNCRNTDALADILNNRNKCGVCGDQVPGQ